MAGARSVIGIACPVCAVVWGAVKGIAKAVPWWAWLALAIGVAFFVYGERKEASGKAAGRAEIQGKWDAAVERGKAELEILKAGQGKITVKTETVYIDRIKVIHEKGQTLIQRIPALVPADACLLPAGFRLLHDQAAISDGELSDSARRANAEAGRAETIAWRPWNTRGTTDRGDDNRPELHHSP